MASHPGHFSFARRGDRTGEAEPFLFDYDIRCFPAAIAAKAEYPADIRLLRELSQRIIDFPKERAFLQSKKMV